MAPKPFIAPIVDSTAVFKLDIFNGKVLFCTGGGSGIGKGMVRAMMRHGADAVILGRSAERLEKAAAELTKETGRQCLTTPADVRKPEQVRAAVAKAIEKFGRIDFVINAAAGNFLAPISGLSENGFKTVIDIDVLGTYNTIKATLPHVRQTKGAYIHVSTSMHWRATVYQVHVSAAKAAIDATSNVLAVEEGPHGVRSNILTPGPIGDTEGVDRLTAAASYKQEDLIPLGRMGTVAECGSAAVFLFSDTASWISGQNLLIDGGWEHLRMPYVEYPAAMLDPEGTKQKILGAKSKL
jgi:peroxisomal 2,4-dienoyl-CoA reductase